MVNKKIDINIPEIKTIYHVGDIHIRNLKRHTEYLQVFERLRTEITKDLNGAIIYVGGDIVHAKTDMSPELVDMTAKFLRSLSDMAPTIVITGNHDCNLNNKNRLDAILPVIETMNHPNLHYLREAGVYNIANVDFAVMSRLTDITDWPSATHCTASTKIALYHGTVQNAISDTGFKLSNEKVKIGRFNGFDMCLLADVHKMQYLDKAKTIAYCGSLIQQNHGESFENHGLLRWDVKSRTSKFINIENDYGFYTLRIRDGIILNDANLPKKPRLRLQLEDTPITDVQRIIAEVRKKYNVQDVVISNIDTLQLKHKSANGDTHSIIGDIHDVAYQNELLVDYLARNINLVNNELLTEIKEINNTINSKLPAQELSKASTYKLKKLEFSNMFSYGEDNVLDFTDMKGAYGLFAANTLGKSSLIDVLLFCLFDKCSRAFKAIDILNKDKDWMSCKLQFEFENVDYFIERSAKIEYAGSTPHCPVSINFWRVENDIVENLNGEQRRETNANIQQYIGTYENFVLTAMSLQNDNTGFINMTQSGRKNLLASFLGLDIYEKLWIVAKEEIKEVEIIIKEFKKQDLTSDLANVENDIKCKRDAYNENTNILNTNQTYLDKINDVINLHTKQIKDIVNGDLDINELTNNKSDIYSKIDILNSNIEKLEKLMQDTKSNTISLLTEYKKYDIDDIQERKKILATKEREKQELSVVISSLTSDIKHKRDKLEKLKSLEYDKDCKFCMNNIFVKDAIETKSQFNIECEKLDDHNTKLQELTDLIAELSIVNIESDEFNQLDLQIDNLKNTYVKATSELATCESNLTLQQRYLIETENNIALYYKNDEIIEQNRELTHKIKQLNDEKNTTRSIIDRLQLELQKLNGDIKVLENRETIINESFNKVKILEKRFKAYEIYLKAISRDGIPYELISKVVPIFETKANNILTQITDFNIMLSVDNKNIDAYIVYENNKIWSLSLTSGMEKFISSIALRVALNSISNIPKPNCLFIDEGFGNLDHDNIANMALLFNYLKTEYDFLFIISHLDIMRDMIDNMIELKRVDGYSKVDFKE